MRAISITALALMIAACGQPLPPGTERVENLGFGFRHVTIGRWNKFELGHHGYLYYRDRQLCMMGGPPSISPSGKFVIYQDGPSGSPGAAGDIIAMAQRRDSGASPTRHSPSW